MPHLIASAVSNAYLWLFRRTCFERFNRRVHTLALQSLGVMNWQNGQVSGEEGFLSRVAAIRGDGFTALDVGAHHGAYSADLLDRIPGARVFAFEPNPSSFAAISAALQRPTFQAVNAALGEHSGTATLYDYANADGSEHASLHRGVIEDIHRGSARAWEVQLLTLDDFLAEQQIGAVDLLKIDAEGNELNVLKGAAKALSAGSIALVQFEFNEMNLSSRVFFKDFSDLLRGYQLYRLMPDGMIRLEERPYGHFHNEIFAFQNIVAIRMGSIYDCPRMTGR